MKETICTIPINDIFMPKDGCPICRMEDMLEKQYVKFITGDAMMEPNIRIETNKKGFCHRHFSQMFTVGQKLPNALILESHLQEIIDKYMPAKLKGKPDKNNLRALRKSYLPAMSVTESQAICTILWQRFLQSGQRAKNSESYITNSRLSA